MYLDIKTVGGCDALGPGQLLGVRRRTRQAVRGPARPAPGRGPRSGRRPRLRPRQPDPLAGAAMAVGPGGGSRLVAGDGGACGRRQHRRAGDVHGRRCPAVATGRARRRPGQQRHPAVGSRSPGPAADPGRRGTSGRVDRVPGAGQLRRPHAHGDGRRRDLAALGRPVRGPRAGPAGRRHPGPLPRAAGRPRLHGGCVGDDVPARAHRSGRRGALGQRHRAAALPPGPRRRRRARRLPRRLPGGGGGGLPERPWGTVLPFRRGFVVAQRAAGS